MKKTTLTALVVEFVLLGAGTATLTTLFIQKAAALTDCTPSRTYQTLAVSACSTGDNLLYKSERNWITFPGGAQFTKDIFGVGACKIWVYMLSQL